MAKRMGRIRLPDFNQPIRTKAEARLIKAALKHLEHHGGKIGTAYWTWACHDEALAKAVAAVVKERGKK